ncbi:MAG: L-seryl-tRNA(Sec) selenium transferase [Acidobacteriota bacterium]
MDAASDPRRALPSVDRLLAHPALERARVRWSHRTLAAVVRSELNVARQPNAALAGLDTLADRCSARLESLDAVRPKRVINATGVVIHTNLGRAPLDHAVSALVAVASGYNTLEFDLSTGGRGTRGATVDEYFDLLFPEHQALVVNNNAAALLLALNTLAHDREVIISRGELVEIGGSFRVPEILQSSGGRLCEVGTTNRTHAHDYATAIGPHTALILKVWPSNYRVVGYTKEVPITELAELSKGTGLPLLADQGCGRLLEDSPGPSSELSVEQLLADGADLVCFSGDKLLGGPQCGVLVGAAPLIARCAKNPMMRALRPDKLTFAALAATLRAQLAADTEPTVATQMLRRDLEELTRAAHALRTLLRARLVTAELDVVEGASRVGGGAAPEEDLPTALVTLRVAGLDEETLMNRLRSVATPVIARVANGCVCFDPRTLRDGEAEELAEMVAQAVAAEPG